MAFVRVDHATLTEWLEERPPWAEGVSCPRSLAVMELQSRIELGLPLPPHRELARRWGRSRDWVRAAISEAHAAQRRVRSTGKRALTTDHPSTTGRPGADHPSTTDRPGTDHPSTTDRPGSDHPSTTDPEENQEVNPRGRPGTDHPSTTERPGTDHPSTTERPGTDHPSTTGRPPTDRSNIESRSGDLRSGDPLSLLRAEAEGEDPPGADAELAAPKVLSAFWNTHPDLPRGARIPLFHTWPLSVLGLGPELAQRAADAYIRAALKGSEDFRPSPVSHTQFVNYAGEIAQWATHPEMSEPQMGRKRRSQPRGGSRRGAMERRGAGPARGSAGQTGGHQSDPPEPPAEGKPIAEWLAERGLGAPGPRVPGGADD